jgi:hypothetical protein
MPASQTLAAERVHVAPFRYYVWLPALRIADMWLRPRTKECYPVVIVLASAIFHRPA